MSVERIKSIDRFKQLARDLQREVRQDAIDQLNLEADELVTQMQAVAPLGPTGNLRRSIRKAPGKKETTVKILAGGALTTVEIRKGSGGVPYDYSRAVEFGTTGAPAHPFFFPLWRLRKKKVVSRMKRRITADIKAKSAG